MKTFREIMTIICTAVAVACLAPGAMAQDAAPAEACQTSGARVEALFTAQNVPFRVLTGNELKLFDDLVFAQIGQHAPADTQTIIVMDPTGEGWPEDAQAAMVVAINGSGCMIGGGQWPAEFVRSIMVKMASI